MTLSAEPEWLTYDFLLEIIETVDELYPAHSVTLTRSGDLKNALMRPVNRYHYGHQRDLFALSAEYVYGIGKAHALIDGNKRVSFQAALVFLELNGVQLDEPADEFFAIYIQALMADRINIEMLSTVFAVFSSHR